jgi:hypothetical protein
VAAKKKIRPTIGLPISAGLEEIGAFISARREAPVIRANDKIFQFVNACVGDPDFRHPDSRPLLEFLLFVRDVLTDELNEQWTFEDILEPLRQHFAGRGRPTLDQHNQRNRISRELAKQYAQKFFEANPDALMSKAALSVKRKLIDDEMMQDVPETLRTIKAWIKEVAPSSASRRGRPRKTGK